MLLDLVFKYYFKLPKDNVVLLGNKLQPGSITAIVYASELWKKEPLSIKLKSFFTKSYVPDRGKLKKVAHEILVHEIFGGKNDFGDELLKLMIWHNSQNWNIDKLTSLDKTKADSIQSLSILTRTVFREKTSIYLNLNLAERAPQMFFLTFLMVIKIPVVSIRNYLDIDCSFAFNSIRRSLHPKSEDLISYLYDILFIQQKIANSLHEYLRQITYVENRKNNSSLTMAEIIAIMGADLVFVYLKASIEKTIVFLGLIYEISNLESKKEHKKRLGSLLQGIPDNIKELPYFEFIHEFIKSENLEELNNYRSGILHKKGISDLQPHNYVGKTGQTIPLRKVYDVLLEQHAKNTAVLLGILALLTDDLVKRDPPKINQEELFKSIFEFNES